MNFRNAYLIVSHNDMRLSENIRSSLLDEGLPCQMSSISLSFEEIEQLRRILKAYDVFIIIWSKSCSIDVGCNMMITQAVTLNKKLIIISFDDTALPGFLLDFNVIDGANENFLLKLKNELGIRLDEDRKHSKEHYEECLKSYKTYLESECGYLKILGSGNRVPIRQIYLPLYVKDLSYQSSEPIEATNLLAVQSQRVVVLGNPGTGKTTLLKYLSYKHINDISGNLPFSIRIPDLMKTSSNIYDYIILILKQKITKHCADALSKDEAFCNSSKSLILLDGLDEISTNDLSDFYKRLQYFIENFPKCKIIVTSRFNGYERLNFDGFSEYQMEQLRPIDIERYIWLVCKPDEKGQILSVINSDSRLLELCKTPFLLAMICTLPNSVGKRAGQRAQLFQLCTQYLLRNVDWQEGRQVVNTDKAKILEMALQVIAIRFFKLDRKEAFDEQELIFVLGRLAGNTLNLSPSEILNLICENSGLLQRAGSIYHFIHRSIWEYFVAKGMLGDSAEAVFERANIAAWEEPIRLYVGLLNERELTSALTGIWRANKGLALRCMMEVENFPETILGSLFEGVEKEERLGLIRKLRDDLGIFSSPLDAKRILIDTLTALLRLERDCEVVYNALDLLEEFLSKNKGCSECTQLISNTLDLANAEKRRNTLLANETFMFKFVCIPAGKFIMGKNNISSTPEEKPEHLVKLDSYCIGQYPVTNAAYYEGLDFPFRIDKREGRSDRSQQPAISITWYEAILFARWLGCDLPTEAEWENACRVGGREDDMLYDKKMIKEYAWFVENSNNKTHDVGQKQPNEYKLYDMIGNVREWCKDWFDPEYYGVCAERGEVENPQGPEKGTARSMRGGCFDWNYANLVPTYRNYNQPSDSKFMNGFRLVFRDITVTKTKFI